MNNQLSSQFHRASTGHKSLKGWTILIIAALSSTLLVITGYASPLPPLSEHSEDGPDITASGTNLRLPVRDLGIASPYLQLDSRGAAKKITSKLALAINSDRVLLGFAYLDPEYGQQFGQGTGVYLADLRLPALTLESSPRALYLLPQLGLPAQNPNNWWSCVVYASMKEINEDPFWLSEEEREDIPRGSTPPTDTKFYEFDDHQGIAVMKVSYTAERRRGMWAECYQSPSNLPKKVQPSWNHWRELSGMPKHHKLA
ncbi:hypothetical protein F5050DRAFT_642384 [Lentinula boryana]|uniref:Uncharacterized protein n=1 Tax=Lentinula boryana TaxID=40481 RepID=A0ABQ8Q5P0_9AGAR|nr:hypothetical protein F5050DRAFT_642384 [Lentinula boryana]